MSAGWIGVVGPSTTASRIRSTLIEKYDFDPYTLRDFYRLYMSDFYLENNVLRMLGSGDSTMRGTGSNNPVTDSILYVMAAAVRESLGMPVSNRTGFVPSYLHGGTHPYARRKAAQTLTITGTPTGGTFRLTYSGQETANIAYNATAANVQSALESLSNIDVGDVNCFGGPLPGAAVTIEFQGALNGVTTAITVTNPAFTGGTAPAGALAATAVGSQTRTATVPGYQMSRIDGANPVTWQYDLPQGHTEVYAVGCNRTGTNASATYAVSTGGVDPTGSFLFRTNALAEFEVFVRALSPGAATDNSDKLEITAFSAAAASQFWQAGIKICDSSNGISSQFGIDITDLSCSGTMIYDASNSGLGLFRGDQVDATPSAAGVYTSSQGYSVANNVGRWTNNVDTWGKHRICFTNYAVNGQGATTISTSTAAAELERIKLAQLWCDIRGSAANCFHVQIGNLGAGFARDAQLAMFNGMLSNFCDSAGMPFINIMKAFQVGGRSKLPAGYDFDGIHLTTEGYAAVGAVVAECILEGRRWYLAAKSEGLVA